MMNPERLAVVKNVPTSTYANAMMKPTTPGEYKKIAKRTCRVVKYPMERTFAAASSRPTPFSSDFKGTVGGDSEACCRTRGQLATFLAVLQSVTSARTGTTHPAACSRCARRAMMIECPPCSVNTSSNSNDILNTALQIASTSSHSGVVLESALGGVTSASPVWCELASVSLRTFSASG